MFELLRDYFIIRDALRAYKEGTLLYYIAAILFLIILGFVIRRVFGIRVLKKASDYCFYAFFILIGSIFIYVGVVAMRSGGSYYEGGMPLILFLGIVFVLFPFFWSFLNIIISMLFSVTGIKKGKKDIDN